MEDKIKGWIVEGFKAAIDGTIENIKEGIKSLFNTLSKSYQFAFIDFVLFIILCILVFYCYVMIIGEKQHREKAAGRMYFACVAAFIIRITYTLLLK